MNIFTANFKRVLTSKLFYFSILGVTLICLFGAYTDGTPMVIQCFMNTLLISSYRNLIVFLAALPFSAAFCIEWNSRSTYYIVKRTSLKQYLLSHITTQFLSAFMITFIGMYLAIGVMSLSMSEFCGEISGTGIGFSKIANESHCELFLFLLIFHYSISVAAWSVTGLTVSAFFNDPYIAVSSPIVVSYVIELFTIGSSRYTDLWMLSLSYCNVSDSPLIASAYITTVFLALGAIFATIFFRQAKRRIYCVIV